MNSKLFGLSNCTSSEGKMDLAAIKTPPPFLCFLSFLYIVNESHKISLLRIEEQSHVSVNTIISRSMLKLDLYKADNLERMPRTF